MGSLTFTCLTVVDYCSAYLHSFPTTSKGSMDSPAQLILALTASCSGQWNVGGNNSVTVAWYSSDIWHCWLSPIWNGVQCLIPKETVHVSASVSGSFHCEKDFPPSSFSLFSLSPKVRLMEQKCPNGPAGSEWPQPTCRLWLMKINYCDCKSLNCIIMQHDCVNS